MQNLTASLEHSTTQASPTIDVYLPEGDANGIGIIIFPGGGYRHLAEHEGKGYAEFFQKHGITSFVVTYRLGSDGFKHPAMLEDALAALETIRKKADNWGIRKLGIMGSSAGGHLSAHTAVAYDRYSSSVSLRPDFAILCYPVIAMDGDFAHAGCRENLLGDTPSTELVEQTSPQNHVSETTPPCFIWHTVEDAAVPVENSFMFAQALRKKAVPFELHIYTKGRHGLGLNAEFNWGDDCLRWIKEIA
ncbi:MAG: prolyl oligopeptidase family serine peptidase [Trueperaceae bacterium]|nr:prolyl oligopeptidase family serine peptidase [Trueperaceae bacterium]